MKLERKLNVFGLLVYWSISPLVLDFIGLLAISAWMNMAKKLNVSDDFFVCGEKPEHECHDQAFRKSLSKKRRKAGKREGQKNK
jgi:hypothetical protein